MIICLFFKCSSKMAVGNPKGLQTSNRQKH
jgi:hypothetical protein